MKSVEQLVARQVEWYEARRRVEAEHGATGPSKASAAAYGPYLLISRELGSGARTVAQAVAEQLDWRVFDREIVNQIAERTQVRHHLIESLDEQTRSLASEILAPALDRHDIGKVGYMRHLTQVIQALGQQGGVVILGRGARYILPRQFGLSVRLMAPLEVRVQRIAAAQGISVEAARPDVEISDRQRTAFIRHYFHGTVDDPYLHDMIINTEGLSAEAVTHIVLDALSDKLHVSPKMRDLPKLAGLAV